MVKKFAYEWTLINDIYQMRSDRHKQLLKKCDKCIRILGPFSIFFISTVLPLLHLFFLFRNYAKKTDRAPKNILIVLIVETVVLTFCYLNLNYALFYTACSDPGSTQKALDKLPEEFSQEFVQNLPVCDRCGLPKPARAHHCSICDECHLRMDHHCPAVGNCVALHNHQAFVVMLIWSVISCLMLALFCIICGMIVVDYTQMISFVIGVASLGLAICLVFFLINQLVHIYKNVTTVEYLTEEAGNYNLGKDANVDQLFGTDLFRFFIPHKNKLTGFEWELPIYRVATT